MSRLLVAIALLFITTAFRVSAAEPAAIPKPLEQEAVKLGKAIEDGFRRGDLTLLDREFDVEALLGRVLRNIAVTDNQKRSFKAGFKSSWRQRGVAATVRNATDYKFLRHRKVGTNITLLFRMLTDQGLNYHEHVLEEGAAGKPKIVDVGVILSGEPISRTMRRLALSAFAAQDRGFMARLADGEADVIRHAKDMQRMMLHTQRQEYDEVLAIYRKLPKSLQREKVTLLHKLMATAQLDEAEYIKTISQWEKLFPRDPSLDLISIDGHVLRKDYGQAIKCIERLEVYVGGDPFLSAMKAGQFRLLGDAEKARNLAEEAQKAEPGLDQAHDVLLSIALNEKRFDDAASILLLWESASEEDFAELVQKEAQFSEFRRSPGYQKYLEGRRLRNPVSADAQQSGKPK